MNLDIRVLIKILFTGLLFLAISSTANAQQSLNVLSWNIYELPGFGKARKARAEAIGELLADSKYDVLLFQEAFTKKARKKLLEGLSANYPYRAGPANPGGLFKANSGLWVLSKFSISAEEELRFSTCAGSDCISKKGALYAKLDWNGEFIQLIVTHMQSSDREKAFAARSVQYVELDAFLNKIQESELLQVLAGDMNTRRSDQLHYEEMINTLEAQSTYITSSSETPSTWDANSNGLIAKKWKPYNEILDYAFITHLIGGFSVESEVVILREEYKKGKNELSDHYAVELRIKKNPEVSD